MARLYDDVVTVQTVATSSILWSWCQPQAFMLSSFTFVITIIIIGVSFAEPLSAEGHYHSHSKPSIGQRNEESCHVGGSSRPNQDPVLQLRKSCLSENLSFLSTARLHLKSFSSCWVFQPMGRWFSSQDRKRSFVCHSVRLRQSDRFIGF